MRHILLTWSLGSHNDEQWRLEEGAADVGERTAAGESVAATWTVANRRNGIESGDRAYLYPPRNAQTGPGPRSVPDRAIRG
jgi:hypothetical protein